MTELQIKKIHPRFTIVVCESCGREVVQEDVWKIKREDKVVFNCTECHPTIETLL